MGLIESKRVQRLFVSNQKNCPFEDLERLLVAVGFVVRKTSGSHVIFKRGALAISVPRRNPVKETYIKQALALIDQV